VRHSLDQGPFFSRLLSSVLFILSFPPHSLQVTDVDWAPTANHIVSGATFALYLMRIRGEYGQAMTAMIRNAMALPIQESTAAFFFDFATSPCSSASAWHDFVDDDERLLLCRGGT
jgi:hypothetical protein